MDAPFPIDFVIPWVDGSDPVLGAVRSRYLTPAAASDDAVAGPTRYASDWEIVGCVASILRFAPFARNVFIVTDGQDPHLEGFISRYFPRTSTTVRVVGHREIFRGREEVLPVFNSRAIGTMIWNIDGLSEHFVYMDDDFALLRPAAPEDFFRGDRVVCYGRWMSAPWVRLLKALRPSHSGFKVQMLNALDYYKGGGSRFICLGHAPRPLLRSWFAVWAEERPDMLRINLTGKFREPFHFQAQEPFVLAMADEGKLALEPDGKNCHYYKYRDVPGYTERKIRSFVLHPDRLSVCMNSLDKCPSEDKNALREYLEGLFSCKLDL